MLHASIVSPRIVKSLKILCLFQNCSAVLLRACDEYLGNDVLLDVEDLWKSYGETVGVAGLFMRVNAGAIHGLIGPNGAGKTTTVKCIVGLLKPDKGRILVMGRNVNSDEGFKRLVGYLPEAPSLPDYLTPKEFLGYIARIRGVEPGEETRKRVQEFLSMFDLKGYENRFILELSKGLKQRLALATVFIHQPKLIIMDEPFIGLDPEGQRLVKNLVKNIVSDGGAALVCTHMLDMAERFCTSATIINRGRSIAEGSIDGLKKTVGLESSATLEEAFFRIVGGIEGGRL
ncbi:MAG: ABC transporter ATP-binding protein [Candidatus Brockarchaeota archaeon]|nr:ABC transporter ATP-binding protein [Candidatus Brockarchaeota archaeon]